MIIPMIKYDFFVFYKEYHDFLYGLKELGVLHITSNDTDISPALTDIRSKLKKIRDIRSLLSKQEMTPPDEKNDSQNKTGEEIILYVEELIAEKQHLLLTIQNLDNAIEYAEPWGKFSMDTLNQLKENGITVEMFSCAEKLFDPVWQSRYLLEIISTRAPNIYFIIFRQGNEKIDIKADLLSWPGKTVFSLRVERDMVFEHITSINEALAYIKRFESTKLNDYEQEVYTQMQIIEAFEQSIKLSDDKILLLSGFVPQFRQEEIEAFCNKNSILYLKEKVKPKDHPPILLNNRRFPKLYEFIGKLYSLPSYAELDLTPFFAPFFMMFFGLCLGDAGYGLLILSAATIYKTKASLSLRPLLALGQWLGLATVIFGIITGTFFGLNLLSDSYAFLGAARKIMLDSNQIFNFALVLGFIQIIFGLCIQIANKVRQYGWKYTVMPMAWIIILFGIADLAILKVTGNFSIYLIYVAIAGILLYNDPDVSLLSRIGKGIWELYSITGFVGDLLSYIRLFALGISGAILGLVVNDIALRLYSVEYIGPVLFVIFLAFGHGLNLMISSLGAFVHPLRLTFVEFYKNAGFTGGGKDYKPFGGRV